MFFKSRTCSVLVLIIAFTFFVAQPLAQGNLIRSISWNPDSTLLATGGIQDGQTGIWIYDTQGILVTTLTTSNTQALAWNSTGSRLATIITGEPYSSYNIWDMDGGNPTTFAATGELSDPAIYWTENDTQLVTVGSYQVIVRDASNGTVVREFGRNASNADVITATSISADDSTIYIASGENVISVWNVSDGSLIRELQLSENIESIAVSPDNTRLALDGFANEVLILDAVTGVTLTSYILTESQLPRGRAINHVWSPDGVTLATVSFEAITLYDTQAQITTAVITDINGFPNAIDYSGTGILSYINNTTATPIYAPTANAGTDQILTNADSSGSAFINLNGSESSDSDGMIISYEWSENGIVIARGINPQVNLSAGVHQIILSVTDDDGAIGGDVVTITVEMP